jgi:hypothetical protein
MAISKQALALLNTQADRIVGEATPWLRKTPLLPTPYDDMQMAGHFVRLGAKLAHHYGLATDWDALREIGEALAQSITSVYGTSWADILSAGEQDMTILEVVGFCIKQYFNFILKSNRFLTPHDVSVLLESSLINRLGW